jgi:hypothetical protein
MKGTLSSGRVVWLVGWRLGGLVIPSSSYSASIQSKHLTSELTGRAINADRFKFSMKIKLTRAPVE